MIAVGAMTETAGAWGWAHGWFPWARGEGEDRVGKSLQGGQPWIWGLEDF